MSIETALGRYQFGKVYIMLGINELSTGTAEGFYQQFKTIVETVRRLQPEAIIFIQSIMHVSADKDGNQGISNGEIDIRNELISKLADNITIYYIDENEALDDENGCLTAAYTYDGIHLEANHVEPWKEFILNHGVVLP